MVEVINCKAHARWFFQGGRTYTRLNNYHLKTNGWLVDHGASIVGRQFCGVGAATGKFIGGYFGPRVCLEPLHIKREKISKMLETGGVDYKNVIIALPGIAGKKRKAINYQVLRNVKHISYLWHDKCMIHSAFTATHA
jgi:hypothetical protein